MANDASVPQKPAVTTSSPAAAKGASSANSDEAGFQDTPTAGQPPKNPATFWQKVVLTIYLFLWVVVLLPSIWCVINRVNASATAEVSVGWELPADVTLKAGPAAFRYDATRKELVHYGPVSAERKLELRALFGPDNASTNRTRAGTPAATKHAETPGDATPAPVPGDTRTAASRTNEATSTVPESAAAAIARLERLRLGYNEAIDNLAYMANVRQGKMLSLFLILGCLGGILGAILRSLVDFVGNACYTQALDLKVWWPLYATRPVVGAILGFVLVVLFKAKLFTTGDAQAGTDSLWWLGVAVIGGFSTVDVTLRLRLAAKALFGVSGDKNR